MKAIYSLFILLSLTSTAMAHNVVGGVYASGFDIEGEVGFSNGTMANAGTVVKVSDVAGTPLGEVITDDQGYFVFTAKKTITHVFQINMGAGHTLTMQLPAEELPDSLDASNTSHAATVTSTNQTTETMDQSVATNNQSNALLLEKAIAKQIKPLRKEIQALKEKSGLRDIIGGIGYIFGLLGVVALLRERRLKAKK